ncbi:MAG: STAS domain-containing protein [Acidobacteria bacterium]|nr:STAS domain-containing protein [Acidobacteriota bacterium]
MSVKIDKREVGGVTVVDLSGRLTLGDASAQLRQTLHELLDQGKKKIVLNLGQVGYIDSSGLGELVSGFTTVKNKGGMLKLANLTDKVNDLLTITKLYTVFEIHNDENTAVQSFS